MFHDSATDTVYVSSALWDRHPHVYDTIQTACTENDIGFRTIHGTPNIWARDFMPLQVGDKYVRFAYRKFGINGCNRRYPSMEVPTKVYDILPDAPQVSRIILDGGNVVRCGERAIITDMVFRHNPECERNKLVAKLENLLCATVIIIPSEPSDTLGHADGIVKWIDPSTLFVNDYPNGCTTYREKLYKIFAKHGIVAKPFPYAHHKRPRMSEKKFRALHPQADEWNSAYGYYLNFLRVKNLILFPVFGIEEDNEAARALEQAYPGVTLVPVDCAYLSEEGGLVHCVTWNSVSKSCPHP